MKKREGCWHYEAGTYFFSRKWVEKKVPVDTPVLNPKRGVRGYGGKHFSSDNKSYIAPRIDGAWTGSTFPAYQGQDYLVLELLENKTSGFYIDLAARYWFKGSNTFILDYFYDWGGICIEPDPAFFRGLIFNRSCEVLCGNPVTAISSEKSETVIFNNRIVEHGEAPMGPRTYKLPTVNFPQVLTHFRVPPMIDYLSLDVSDAYALPWEKSPLVFFLFLLV